MTQVVNWVLEPDQLLNKLQKLCTHNYRCILHRVKTNKVLFNYIKIVSSHNYFKLYCCCFIFDKRLPEVSSTDLVSNELKKCPYLIKFNTSVPGAGWVTKMQQDRIFASDRFYVTVYIINNTGKSARTTFGAPHGETRRTIPVVLVNQIWRVASLTEDISTYTQI